MTPSTPEDIHRLVTAAFAQRDLEGLLTLYEPEAAFVAQPGCVVTGQAAIREALAGFLALKPQLNLTVRRVLRANDIALIFSDWTLSGTSPDGGEVRLEGQTSDVVRRQPDGRWLLVIDNPFGAKGL